MLKTVGNPSSRYGDQTIVDGNVVVGTANKGIDFSASANAPGMTSELLNDYEEGTWTPNQGAGLTVVGAFSSAGRYTKVGRLVHVSGTYTGATSVAAVGGGVMSNNLPFTVGGIGTGALVNNTVSASVNCVAFPGSGFFYSSGAVGATPTIHFSLTYTV